MELAGCPNIICAQCINGKIWGCQLGHEFDSFAFFPDMVKKDLAFDGICIIIEMESYLERE